MARKARFTGAWLSNLLLGRLGDTVKICVKSMKNKIRKLPKIYTSSHALVEVLRFAHTKAPADLSITERCQWLESNLEAIIKIADLGLTARRSEVIYALKESSP